MKRVLQNFKTGELIVSDVPAPVLQPEGILVRTRVSLISAGTESSAKDFAEMNLLEKARSRPDLVKQVVDKARREGLLATYEAVRDRLDQWVPLGYSSAGEVVAVGAAATGFKVEDRVACGGMGYASHAEFAYVPRTLAVKIPEGVSFEEASFATLGAIAMQGVRQAEVSVGDSVGVIGMGLIGRLTAQILQAGGCRVIGFDTAQSAVDEARSFGCDEAFLVEGAVERVLSFTHGRGLDRVIITAQCAGSEPTQLAGELARDRAIVVAVGEVGMDIPRRSYYAKELDFKLSRSYGPGRYDADYEDRGRDYPLGYVRWTEQRNMESFLQLVAAGKVNVQRGISHRFTIAQATDAYALITGQSRETFSSVVLTYDSANVPQRKIERSQPQGRREQTVRLGVIGAGAFATSTFLPALKAVGGTTFAGIASANGVSARSLADRYGFSFCASADEEILGDPRVNAVAILTRHNLHATQVVASFQAGKAVFVEKPLALNEEELQQIERAYAAAGAPPFLVGFNRRFAPFTVELQQRFAELNEPRMITIRVNAGSVPPEHWIHDPNVGGGRLVGEGCHFFDLLHFFAGSPAVSVRTSTLGDSGRYRHDNFVSVVRFTNGSVGTLTYVANGDRNAGKERIEIFSGGMTGRIDDFRELRIFGPQSVKRTARLRADKGHRAEWAAFLRQIQGSGAIAYDIADACAVMRTTFAARQSLLSGDTVMISAGGTAAAASR